MKTIHLLDEEKELLETLGSFDILDYKHDRQRIEAMLDASFTLSKSLLERKAIPDVRLEYFTNPEYNLGRGKKSKKEVFESNGTSGEEILRRPDFMKYLRFFIHGANLPESLISRLDDIYEEEYYDDYRIEKMVPVFKSYFQNSSDYYKRELAEESFKYAIDKGISHMYSKWLRDYVMKFR